jgi:large subunit ribosomal protein L28
LITIAVAFVRTNLNVLFFSGRICPFTGKKANRANKVSFSAHKTKKLQFVNLQYKRIWWEAGKRYVKLRLSTKALKTIEKNGLDAVAKKAGIDLRKQ